ncbi:MAG: hypothetical protein FWF07_03875 [Methanomassiliicoccaceae archaeon]|nr:hypothetical protein [Methanomassiliicoccaceae archaeon]
MIDSVKIKHLDRSIASKGARTLEVRVSSSVSFETPTRPISTTELTAKSFLGYRGELMAPLSALPVDLKTGSKFQKFLKNNGTVNDTRRKLQSMSDSTFMCPSFPILQMPTLNVSDDLPLKIAFDMQCSVEDMDYVCIPAVGPEAESYERIIIDWCESAEDSYGKGAVPQIRMDENPEAFSKKLGILCELSKTGLVMILNVIYANPDRNSVQFAELWRQRENMNAIVNCSEVPSKGKEFRKGVNIDLEEYLIQHGIDSITRKKHSVDSKYIFKRNMEDPPKGLDGIDRYDVAVHSASVRMSGDLWGSTKHPPLCGCSVCRGDNRERLIERFAYKDNRDLERSGMRYFSMIHDHQSDQSELGVMRSFIRSGEMVEYEKQLELKRNELLDSL